METNRLLIRKFEASDAPDLYDYLSLVSTYQFEPGGPVDAAEARRLATERAAGDSFWAVGYIFHPAFHRQGYATEACRALIAYGLLEEEFGGSGGLT